MSRYELKKSFSDPFNIKSADDFIRINFPHYINKNSSSSIFIEYTSDMSQDNIKYRHQTNIKTHREAIEKIADMWKFQFFDLCQKCIDSCTDEKTIELAAKRLAVYFGPKMHKIIMQYRESMILIQLERWKSLAILKLWTEIEQEMLKEQRQNSKPNRGDTIPFMGYVFKASSEVISEGIALNFKDQILDTVLARWKNEILVEYENEHIEFISTNLIYQGYDEKTVKDLVNFPLSYQFREFLVNIQNAFFNCEYVTKFLTTHNLQNFLNDIKKVKEICEKQYNFYNIKKNEIETLVNQRLTNAVEYYKTQTITFIAEDLKNNDASQFYLSLKSEEFVETILDTLKVKKILKKKDYVFSLANLCEDKTKRSLMELAISKYEKIIHKVLKNTYFPIIELMYEYGGMHELAYGKKNGISIPKAETNSVLAWRLIILELSNIPVYNDFEASLKKTLLEYSSTIPELLSGNCFTRLIYDWNGLKSYQRLKEVQEIAYKFLKSSISFNDNLVYNTIKTLSNQVQGRMENSALYSKLAEKILAPLLNNQFFFFGQWTVDSQGKPTITDPISYKLQDENSQLRSKNHHLNKEQQKSLVIIKQLEIENANLFKRLNLNNTKFYNISEEENDEDDELPTYNIESSGEHKTNEARKLLSDEQTSKFTLHKSESMDSQKSEDLNYNRYSII